MQIIRAGQILPAVPTGRRCRHSAPRRLDSLSNADRRKDHSFFSRAIAVIEGMILPLRESADPGDVRRRDHEGTFAMINRACGSA
jgi:hypothetical protein